MKRTILTIEQQNQFFVGKYLLKNFSHKWSTRGMGNSKLLDGGGNVIAKASGCGYDRFGTVLGDLIEHIFPEQLAQLAKKECKGRNRRRKISDNFYGLFYNAVEDKAYLDGGCGTNCMRQILNKIGFDIAFHGETSRSNNGEAFYSIEPLTKNQRKWVK